MRGSSQLSSGSSQLSSARALLCVSTLKSDLFYTKISDFNYLLSSRVFNLVILEYKKKERKGVTNMSHIKENGREKRKGRERKRKIRQPEGRNK